MTRFVSFALSAVAAVLATGCGQQSSSGLPAAPTAPAPAPSDSSHLAQKYSTPVPPVGSAAALPKPATRQTVAPLFVLGEWAPSGWMGDLKSLAYKASADDPPADEWKYDPTAGGEGWAAVAYFSPAEPHFGSLAGKNLSGKGYDRITFKVKSRTGTVGMVFKSGGHTAPGARYPASYETGTGHVSVGTEWKEVIISLENQDLSNVSVALVLLFTERSLPNGATVLIRDIAFRGPHE